MNKGSLIYKHTSDVEDHSDRFIVSVTDGINEVTATFRITITPVDDSIPLLTIQGLKAQKGVRKLISEFDLKAVDEDTKVEIHTFH